MPCVGGPSYEQIIKERLDDTTDTLCSLCTYLKANAPSILRDAMSQNTKLSRWWKQHEIEDESRKQREAEALEHKETRDAALNKLSANERKILGL